MMWRYFISEEVGGWIKKCVGIVVGICYLWATIGIVNIVELEMSNKSLREKVIELKYRLLTDDKSLKRLWDYVKKIRRQNEKTI